jgi:hypothetical protein
VCAQCGAYWDCTGGGAALDVGSLLSTPTMIITLGVSPDKPAGTCANNNVLLGQVSVCVLLLLPTKDAILFDSSWMLESLSRA